MRWSGFFKSKTFVANGVVALVLAVLVATGLNWMLKLATGHGRLTAVPDVSYLPLDQALEALEDAGLEGEVMDSTSYSQKVSPGAVLDQYPRPGTAVKGDRVIKLTLNRSRPALVLVPVVLDKSLARATYDLTSKGFSVGTVTRQPDVSTDVVLAVQSRGKTLAADTKLPYGSVVDLVVSGGVGAGEFSMPDLLGLSLDQLELFLAEMNLVTGVVDLPNQDTTGARVYRQDPAAGASVRDGESVDLWFDKK